MNQTHDPDRQYYEDLQHMEYVLSGAKGKHHQRCAMRAFGKCCPNYSVDAPTTPEQALADIEREIRNVEAKHPSYRWSQAHPSQRPPKQA